MAAVTNGRLAKRIAQRGTHASGKTTGAGLVQSLGRGLALLGSLAENSDGIPLSDLCQQVGLPLSTAHRLLTTLEQQRYVRCDPKTRYWSIGVQAFIVGSAFVKARDLIEIAGHACAVSWRKAARPSTWLFSTAVRRCSWRRSSAVK